MPDQYANQNLNHPELLDRVPRSPEELIAIGAEIMADFLDPEGGLTEHDVVGRMLELFDNPTAIEAYENEIARRRGGRDVDRWH
jgi:hypothetical protein